MSRYDGQLPEELRDIAERLSAARATPTPLELDELRRRVHGRMARGWRSPSRGGRFATLPRMNFVAGLLASGLMLTSGAGVVLASRAIGGGSDTYKTTSFHHEKDASECEYEGKREHDYSYKTKHSTMHVTVLSDCKDREIHMSDGERISYRFGDGPTHDTKSTSYTTKAPHGTSKLTVTADGFTFTLPLSW